MDFIFSRQNICVHYWKMKTIDKRDSNHTHAETQKDISNTKWKKAKDIRRKMTGRSRRGSISKTVSKAEMNRVIDGEQEGERKDQKSRKKEK